MNIKPLSDHIFVEPITEEKVTKSGIYLPENVEEKPMIGKVIAVGPGKTNEEGKLIPLTIKIDDKYFSLNMHQQKLKLKIKNI